MEVFRFYARFLAIFVTKMKKDWINIDQARYKKIMKNREEFPEIAVPGLERKLYLREERWKIKKKRKKRYKKLWKNTIPLVDYLGT
jgi:hypothetical protein